jgi:hypothetical protein
MVGQCAGAQDVLGVVPISARQQTWPPMQEAAFAHEIMLASPPPLPLPPSPPLLLAVSLPLPESVLVAGGVVSPELQPEAEAARRAAIPVNPTNHKDRRVIGNPPSGGAPYAVTHVRRNYEEFVSPPRGIP